MSHKTATKPPGPPVFVLADQAGVTDVPARVMACWDACAGLTPEQVAAIPRLVANITARGPEPKEFDEWARERDALAEIFPRRAS